MDPVDRWIGGSNANDARARRDGNETDGRTHHRKMGVRRGRCVDCGAGPQSGGGPNASRIAGR